MSRTYRFSDSKAIIGDNLVRLRELFVFGTDKKIDFHRLPDQESGATFYWTDDIDSIHFAWYKPDSGIFQYIPEGGATYDPSQSKDFAHDIERKEAYNGSHICEVFQAASQDINFHIKMELYRKGVVEFSAELVKHFDDKIYLEQKFFTPAGEDQPPAETCKLTFAYPSLRLL